MTAKTVALVALCLCLAGPALGEEKAALRLHLPRTVRVRAESLELGSLCVLRGGDEAMVAKASKIAMGRTPWSGETIVVDRRTILSRLACSGVDARPVKITGAEKVLVTRDEVLIDAKRLIGSAEAFLGKVKPGPTGCTWKLVRQPADLAVPAGDDIQLRPRLLKNPLRGHVSVEVAAVRGRRELGSAKMRFKLVYPIREAVAIKDIAAGEVLTYENTRIRITGTQDRPGPRWISPYGTAADRSIKAGEVVRLPVAEAGRAAIVVRRNQAVAMRIEGDGFVISTTGQALQDGRPAEIIKVRNIDSKRIVLARVAEDGTVRPIYERR